MYLVKRSCQEGWVWGQTEWLWRICASCRSPNGGARLTILFGNQPGRGWGA